MWHCTLLLIATFLGVAADSAKETPPSTTNQSKVKDEKLRQELLRRMQADQEARKPVIALIQNEGGDPDEVKQSDGPTVKHMREIDHQNTTRMKEIVKQYGWPGKSLVGKDGAHAAWILVQHAAHDRPFQKQCLELLKAAVKNGEATGEELAYLTDRVLVSEKKKQVYGTQLLLVEGKFQPHPIENAADVDKRRKEVGLSSLANYLKFSQWVLDQAAKSKSGQK